jgi:hypothetical protein
VVTGRRTNSIAEPRTTVLVHGAVKPKDEEDGQTTTGSHEACHQSKEKFVHKGEKRNRDLISHQAHGFDVAVSRRQPRSIAKNTAPSQPQAGPRRPGQTLGTHLSSPFPQGRLPPGTAGGQAALGASWSNPSRPRTAILVGPTTELLAQGSPA